MLSTLLIRLDEFQIAGLGDPLCISRIDSVLRPVRLRIGTIARSRRLSHGNPEHNFLHTSFKSPEIMRCCGSVHEYTACRNTTYGEVYKCFSLPFSCAKDYLENRGFEWKGVKSGYFKISIKIRYR